MKLLNKKSYSAPYIIFSDLYPEQLHDNEEDMLDEDKANSTTMMQNIELQMQNEDGEEMTEEQMARMLQQHLVQQHQQMKQRE